MLARSPKVLHNNSEDGTCLVEMREVMGVVIKADFKIKLSPKLQKFDSRNSDPAYHSEIFSEMYPKFPQFKAHVAAYVERNYCTVINDEDHPTPQNVLNFLKPHEVRWLNEWILTRGHVQPKGQQIS